VKRAAVLTTAVLAAALAALVDCDDTTPTATPSAVALDEVVDVAQRASIQECHDVVLAAAADTCVVTSGPEAGALVEPVGTDANGRITASTTSRKPT
jgi:hypothetical protein